MNSKAKWSWTLYDWANSAFATTVMAGFFPIFFKKYYSSGIDPVQSTAQFGIANTLGSFVIALLAPLMGAIADQGGHKKKFLFLFTYIGILSTACLALVQEGQWQLAAVVYVIANVGFAGATSFYDSLLPSVASPAEIDRLSAIGYGYGYLGGGLLFAINVMMFQKPELFGIANSVLAIKYSFLSVGAWWALFSIPLFLWVKEPQSNNGSKNIFLNTKNGLKEFVHTVKCLRRLKTLSLFLAAFFLYNDGVGTTIRMAVDYGVSIGFQPSDLILALLLVQFVGFPCAILFGKIAERTHPKKAIYGAIAMYVFITLWATQISETWEFYVLAVLIGLVQGGIQALSRSYYSRFIPMAKSGEFYGFYNLLGKFTGLIGPAMVGIVALLFNSTRVGLGSIMILFIAGALVLSCVDEKKGAAELASL